MTGSVNQHGQVQPIGGVNEKIEGFFEVCSTRGLSGEQGVIIPASNTKNLMLHPDVVEAVRQGQFHIYEVHSVDEAITLLTGVEAGEITEEGEYPEGTVNARAYDRLHEMTLIRQHYAEHAKEDREDSEQDSTAGEAPPAKGE
jgi:predicted ATP-dependent protease